MEKLGSFKVEVVFFTLYDSLEQHHHVLFFALEPLPDAAVRLDGAI